MKRLEIASNVAVLCTALLLSYVLVSQYIIRPRAAQSSAPHPAEGKQLSLVGVNWSTNKHTLVMAMSSHCGFCIRSAPFYHSLGLNQVLKEKGVALVAVLPEDTTSSDTFLNHYDVKVDKVVNSQLANINVEATPTLLLVNQKGVVEREWIGLLDPAGESQVRSQLYQ